MLLQTAAAVTQNTPRFPPPFPPAGDTQTSPTNTSVSKRDIYGKIPPARGLLPATSSGTRAQRQAWKGTFQPESRCVARTRAKRTLWLEFCCCQNQVPRCSSSILEKCVILSGFGRNFDREPIWSGHVQKSERRELPPSLADDDRDNPSLATCCTTTGERLRHTQMCPTESKRIIHSSSIKTPSLQPKYREGVAPPRQKPRIQGWKGTHPPTPWAVKFEKLHSSVEYKIYFKFSLNLSGWWPAEQRPG